MKNIVSIFLFALAVLFLSSYAFAGVSTKSTGPAFLNLDDTQGIVLSDGLNSDDDKEDDDDEDDDKDKH